jgi:hypothetical protein
MELLKHTSGPWFTNQGIPYVEKRLFNVWDIKGNVIARVYGEEANARLIAAAPELLHALQKIIEFNQQHAKDQYGDASKCEAWACIKVARAAIAKVEAA